MFGFVAIFLLGILATVCLLRLWSLLRPSSARTVQALTVLLGITEVESRRAWLAGYDQRVRQHRRLWMGAGAVLALGIGMLGFPLGMGAVFYFAVLGTLGGALVAEGLTPPLAPATDGRMTATLQTRRVRDFVPLALRGAVYTTVTLNVAGMFFMLGQHATGPATAQCRGQTWSYWATWPTPGWLLFAAGIGTLVALVAEGAAQRIVRRAQPLGDAELVAADGIARTTSITALFATATTLELFLLANTITQLAQGLSTCEPLLLTGGLALGWFICAGLGLALWGNGFLRWQRIRPSRIDAR